MQGDMYVTDRRVVVYPAYIDSRKSAGEGRRIPRGAAVEDPDVNEIASVLPSLGLPFEVEAGEARRNSPRAPARLCMVRGMKRVSDGRFRPSSPPQRRLTRGTG